MVHGIQPLLFKDLPQNLYSVVPSGDFIATYTDKDSNHQHWWFPFNRQWSLEGFWRDFVTKTHVGKFGI